jgi:hypothetical protein
MKSLLILLFAATAFFIFMNLVALFHIPVYSKTILERKDFERTDAGTTTSMNQHSTNVRNTKPTIVIQQPIFFDIKKYSLDYPPNSEHPPDSRSIHNHTNAVCNITLQKCTLPFMMRPMLNQLMKEWKSTSPRLISIRGERHSGTKLARSLIQKNAIGLLDSTTRKSEGEYLYGWKHGFFLSDGRVHTSDIILILVRDVFSWAIAMFKEPYNMMFDEGTTDFGTFLKGYYRTQNCEYTWAQIPKSCIFPMEQAENIIQVWPHLHHAHYRPP